MTTNEHGYLVGQIIDERYLIQRPLSEGGVGAVYRGLHVRTGGPCAVKVLKPDALEDADMVARFRDEARVTSQLRHPAIVQVYDYGEMPCGSPYMVMEYLPGESLYHRMLQIKRFSLSGALPILRQVAQALHAAHRKHIVHRDLKPGNILLTRAEDDSTGPEQVKLIDFGMSQLRGGFASDRTTGDCVMLGTPQYISPEGALGKNSQLDGRSDQFSLAVIAYRMLSGRAPFEADANMDLLYEVVYGDPPALATLRPDLPAHVCQAIHRALSKSQADRFDTIMDFVDALAAAPAAQRTPAPRPAWQNAKLRLLRAAAALLPLLMLHS